MLLEKDRQAQKDLIAKTQRETLEELVQKGKSAERLLTNQDWRRISYAWKHRVETMEAAIMQNCLDIISKSDMTEAQDHAACNAIRVMYAQVFMLKQVLTQPEEDANSGTEAEKELSKLRGQHD